MNTQLIDELKSKLSMYDHKLDLLLKKGGNDERIVAKRKEILKQYFELINNDKKTTS
jgi:hypothetical protein